MVRRWVREWKAAHGYGAREAEVDWGTAWVEMERQLPGGFRTH